MSNTQQKINEVCNSVRDLLLEKNRKYGDSALNPSRIFSKSDAVEQIKVRIDDKLSRIATSGTSGVDEDTLQDLIGYLVLLKIATEQVPFAATYEDVLEDAATAATAGQELLNEYGVDDVDNQELDYWEELSRWRSTLFAKRQYCEWDPGDNYTWDPNLGPVELSQAEIDSILSKKDLDKFDQDEIVSTVERRGMVIGFKKDGSSCLLNTNGTCQ